MSHSDDRSRSGAVPRPGGRSNGRSMEDILGSIRRLMAEAPESAPTSVRLDGPRAASGDSPASHVRDDGADVLDLTLVAEVGDEVDLDDLASAMLDAVREKRASRLGAWTRAAAEDDARAAETASPPERASQDRASQDRASQDPVETEPRGRDDSWVELEDLLSVAEETFGAAGAASAMRTPSEADGETPAGPTPRRFTPVAAPRGFDLPPAFRESDPTSDDAADADAGAAADAAETPARPGRAGALDLLSEVDAIFGDHERSDDARSDADAEDAPEDALEEALDDAPEDAQGPEESQDPDSDGAASVALTRFVLNDPDTVPAPHLRIAGEPTPTPTAAPETAEASPAKPADAPDLDASDLDASDIGASGDDRAQAEQGGEAAGRPEGPAWPGDDLEDSATALESALADDHAGQKDAEQEEAGQDLAEQDLAEQGHAEQGHAEQDPAQAPTLARGDAAPHQPPRDRAPIDRETDPRNGPSNEELRRIAALRKKLEKLAAERLGHRQNERRRPDPAVLDRVGDYDPTVRAPAEPLPPRPLPESEAPVAEAAPQPLPASGAPETPADESARLQRARAILASGETPRDLDVTPGIGPGGVERTALRGMVESVLRESLESVLEEMLSKRAKGVKDENDPA